MKSPDQGDRDNYYIRFCVAELVDVMADQADRTPWRLHHVQVGPKGEDAVVTLIAQPGVGFTEAPCRLDIQIRGYWVAGLGRPSEPGQLPLRWASDPPKSGTMVCGAMGGVNATIICIREPDHPGGHRCGSTVWANTHED